MNFYGAKQLAESMRTVRKNTILIAEDIPEESYSYRPTPESRSIVESLFHIVTVWRFSFQIHEVERRSSIEGFDFTGYFAQSSNNEKLARSKREIIEALQTEGERFSNWVESLSDSFLAEPVRMPAGANPAEKSRFEMLLGAKEHEMHHRAQLMVMQRLLGIVPHLTRNRQRSAAETAKATT
ncbi:MAG: DinB family protein [Acidobacteriota bacterium]